jgi:hypothetical protein
MRNGITHVAAAAVLLALPLLAAACSDGAKPSGSGAGPGATSGAAQTASATVAASASASASAAAVGPSCAIDEAQYVDWDEWGKGCGFAVPRAPGALPPRISWEACGPAVGLSGCRKIKLRAGAALTSVRAAQKRQDVVEVAYVEECKTETSKVAQLVIHEADGPTLAAFASKGHEAGKCDVEVVALNQGAYVARLNGEAGGSGAGAFVGAPTQTSKPSVLVGWDAGSAPPRGVVVSDVRWLRFGPDGATSARWGDPPEAVTESSLNVEPSLNHHEILWADVDAFAVKGGKVEKLRESTGKDSLSALGTDGNHLAFTHKVGVDAPKLTLMAGGYTVEADKLSLQSVAPIAGAVDATPWAVGCGHAAHAVGPNQVMIVRIKDGVSWTASSKGCEADGLCLQRPLAVTCSEVFYAATGKGGKDPMLVRITLAGLGKGKEPATPPAPLVAAPGAATAAPKP